MKYIKSYFQHLNEGAYIDPNNFDEVILTFSNLKKTEPEYDNEVLVTLVDTRGKSEQYPIDKYFALLLASDNIGGLSKTTLKNLDHIGRPKVTMDLLKDGKIKGGQLAIDDFLSQVVPKMGDMRYVSYVCSLDSTGPLVKMMENFFISKYKSVPVDIPKATFQTISSTYKIDLFIGELIASENTVKKEYKEALKKFKEDKKIIDGLIFRGLRLSREQQELTEPENNPAKFIKDTIKKLNSTINKFLGALEETIDIPGTDIGIYNSFVKNKKLIANNIINIYMSAGDVSDPYYPVIKPESISSQIQQLLDSYLDPVSIQPNFKIRTSGTAVGGSMRRVFKDKYLYTTSFEEAVKDCIENNKKMIIIDDNINSGTDFRNIDKKIQEIFKNFRFPLSKRVDMIKNIKMFVLYDMKSKMKMAMGSKQIKSLETDKNIAYDFKQSILGKNAKIPKRVIMSGIIGDKNVPIPSLPTLKLKINPSGKIEDMDTDYSKTNSSYISGYASNIDPINWNFPFNIGDQIFNEDGSYIDKFEKWAESTGIFVNGKKYVEPTPPTPKKPKEPKPKKPKEPKTPKAPKK